ncbi:uncharacterized protein SCHCODRAFT_01238761 [Schizophyllum commune H4-8]|uniref:uncharacterized protein n=1 Tax=Schizophyllum commune (strain H4-8 / FGSC 9210) TaxID=578458 RepID=UPI00215FAAC3|nr:uncharacterized protein SCHCODRAFT_01238761 [Schizophyllum commune H4-8]KAI5887491.1 hypothetical protein SCHCODRAFT_01238761 [Schizophyllum commune H4-8]
MLPLDLTLRSLILQLSGSLVLMVNMYACSVVLLAFVRGLHSVLVSNAQTSLRGEMIGAYSRL